MEKLTSSCIYKIQNIITGEFYIGSAINFQKRRWHHLYELNNNKHHSPILQNSFNKHGKENFEFSIIEIVLEKEKLIESEQYYIDNLNPKYNCSKTAGSCLGFKHSLEARINMSKSHLGKKLTPESIAKRSLKQSGVNHPFYGKKRSDEDKQKIREGHKRLYESGYINKTTGIKKSDESKLKISEKLMKPILQFNKNGDLIKEWKGSPEAEKELNINRVNINQCCNGRLKTSGGFVWCFKDNLPTFNFNKKNIKPVVCFNENKLIEFDNAIIAAQTLGVNLNRTYNACKFNKFYRGYFWKYK